MHTSAAVYSAVSGSTPTTHGPSSFDDWFAQHPGRQATFSQPVVFDQSTGAYSFALPSFWPIDGEDPAMSPSVLRTHFPDRLLSSSQTDAVPMEAVQCRQEGHVHAVRLQNIDNIYVQQQRL